MTLGALSADGGSSSAAFCSCCGAQMGSYYRDQEPVSHQGNHVKRLISESFLTVNDGVLYLPRRTSPPAAAGPRSSSNRNQPAGDLQKHLHTMFSVLRPEDTIRLAVRLEGAAPQVTRYMVVVSTNGRQDTEESAVLGVDFVSDDSCCSVGLVLPLWSDTRIHLDGDGGFSVSTVNRIHVFKPVSVQAMWSALQSLHKACEVARRHNHYPGSPSLTWVSYYGSSSISSSQRCINEWNALQDVEPHYAKASLAFSQLPTERENMERLIRKKLWEIMMQKDLESVTCKEIRTELEMQMVCDLAQFKKFIGNEMIVILGQMDSPTKVFEHVYLGSEWNASNLDELQTSGVRYILNVTREIDNFFPGMFEYHNIRVYDEEATNLLEYWNDTYKFITKAKNAGSKCLVHCKMGMSRSASTVIAYAMKEYGWDLDTAFEHVKERRSVTQPNPAFMKQLEEYQGILLASKQRHNKLWRSHPDFQLVQRPQSTRKPSSSSSSSSSSSPPLGRSDSHSSSSSSSSSLNQLLNLAVLQALTAPSEPRGPAPSEHHNSAPSEHQGHAPSDSTGPTPSHPYSPDPLKPPDAASSKHQGPAPSEHQSPAPSEHCSPSPPGSPDPTPSEHHSSAPSELQGPAPFEPTGPAPRPQAATLVLDQQLISEGNHPPLHLTNDPPPTTSNHLIPDLLSLTPDPTLLTFDPILSISQRLETTTDNLSLTPASSLSTLDPLFSTNDLPFLTSDRPPTTFDPSTLDLLSLTPDPSLSASDLPISDPPLTTFDAPLLTSDPSTLTFDLQRGQGGAEHTGVSSVSSEQSCPAGDDFTLNCCRSHSHWFQELPEPSDLLLDPDPSHHLDRSLLPHSHDDIIAINQFKPSLPGGDDLFSSTEDSSQNSSLDMGQDSGQGPSWSLHSHQRAPQSPQQESEEGEESRHLNLPGNSSLSASQFETERKDARQAPPSSQSIPAHCSDEWAEPLRPGWGEQASVAPPATDIDRDDGGHVLPASDLEELREPPSCGRSPGHVTLTATLQEPDEPETVQQGGLSPPVENWKGRRQDPGAPSPPVEDWRGRGQDQGGLGVRVRQAGLTPPSLLKRSASLAKLDNLQLSTLDLSDLDPRSGGGSGWAEPR